MKGRDPMSVYEKAMDFMSTGQYADALSELIWLQSETIDSDYLPLRRTYALAAWIELAKEFEPAKVAIQALLQSRRDQLNLMPGNVELAKDLGALEERIKRLS